MKIITSVTPISYTYNPARARASYTLDGTHWMNHGEFCERMAKVILGFTPSKDSVAFDKGYDIPELKASVKSYKCGLSNCKDMPTTPKAFLAEFWARDIAELHIYVCDHGEYMTLYMMNTPEFQRFIGHFAKWDESRKNFRLYTCDSKVEAWLMANYAEVA
jgi:hypothetical protein